MGNRLYVGNLAFHTTEDTLKDHFAGIGGVTEAVIVLDRMTGRSRGFGFVTMESDDLAKRAADELNNSTLDGRNLKVNEAEARREGGGGGGGRGFGGGGGGRGPGGGGGGGRGFGGGGGGGGGGRGGYGGGGGGGGGGRGGRGGGDRW